MDFLNKKVIITGAYRSIGQQIALDLASKGAEVLISYRNHKASAEQTVKQLNEKHIHKTAYALHADFSTMENIAAFAKQALKHLGHVDILINNAGIMMRERLLDLAPENMQTVFQTNTIAPLYLSQLCAKNMIQHNINGCIINISSIAGTHTVPKGIGYAASKAAMNKWTQNAALDLSEYGIRVNAVAPGIVQAGMNESEAANNPESWHKRTKDIPLKRTGIPEDIASMVLYLASEKANWITGKVIEVDGGSVL